MLRTAYPEEQLVQQLVQPAYDSWEWEGCSVSAADVYQATKEARDMKACAA